MPQLDLVIWFTLVSCTICVFWIVYIISLLIYRELIIWQGYLLKLKQLIIFFINSVFLKFLFILKQFLILFKDYIFEKIWSLYIFITNINIFKNFKILNIFFNIYKFKEIRFIYNAIMSKLNLNFDLLKTQLYLTLSFSLKNNFNTSFIFTNKLRQFFLYLSIFFIYYDKFKYWAAFSFHDTYNIFTNLLNLSDDNSHKHRCLSALKVRNFYILDTQGTLYSIFGNLEGDYILAPRLRRQVKIANNLYIPAILMK